MNENSHRRPRCNRAIGSLGWMCLLVVFLLLPKIAIPELVTINIRAVILLRALRYERGFASGDGEAKLVVVAAASGTSARDAAGMEVAFRHLARSGVAGRPVKIERLTFNSAAETLAELRRRKPQVVYVAHQSANPGLKELPRGTISLCAGSENMMNGCVLTVEIARRKPRIVVHLRDARRAGLSFDSRLLRMVRLIL